MSGNDIRFGRRGGSIVRWEGNKLADEVAAGRLVLARCDCSAFAPGLRGWWVSQKELRRPCDICGEALSVVQSA
ncbi:MAG TPA: hypothetical protein VNF73_01185 [Candidatus Saccharimonadales bacterium]|nr:hypothetical protein [Candidatus Saccharimonadales bacterium]